MLGTRSVLAALILAGLFIVSPVKASCEGDCNGDGRVSVDELIHLINIALGNQMIDDCADFEDGCGDLDVLCPFKPLVNALQGCDAR
jgi:hypothetical protein